MLTNKKGKNYILAIAINAYQKATKLNNCVDDASAIVDILISKYNFSRENVIQLFDEQATKANIYQTLASLARKITKRDNLLIYFAGHGYYNKESKIGYLIPVEAENYWDYLSNADFLNLIRSIHSLHTFLLMDSCFSGALFRSGNNSTQLAENLEKFPSRWGLAAGRIEEVEDGLHGENSPFAKSIIQFLESNTNSKFPASELVQYTKRVTPVNAHQTPIGGRLYKVGDMDGEFVFRLKKDEDADWKDAVADNSLTAYQSYLDTYPEGRYIADAQDRIIKLSAEKWWQKIQNTKDDNIPQINHKLTLIDDFIKRFSKEDHYREVLREGKKMKCKKRFLNAKEDYYSLLEFIDDDPPFFKQEASQLLSQIKKNKSETPIENVKMPSTKEEIPVTADELGKTATTIPDNGFNPEGIFSWYKAKIIATNSQRNLKIALVSLAGTFLLGFLAAFDIYSSEEAYFVFLVSGFFSASAFTGLSMKYFFVWKGWKKSAAIVLFFTSIIGLLAILVELFDR